jgi:hypothetical protein
MQQSVGKKSVLQLYQLMLLYLYLNALFKTRNEVEDEKEAVLATNARDEDHCLCEEFVCEVNEPVYQLTVDKITELITEHVLYEMSTSTISTPHEVSSLAIIEESTPTSYQTTETNEVIEKVLREDNEANEKVCSGFITAKALASKNTQQTTEKNEVKDFFPVTHGLNGGIQNKIIPGIFPVLMSRSNRFPGPTPIRSSRSG